MVLVDFIGTLGPWAWFIAGLLLLVAELLLPGVFLMWIGISAIIVGTLSLFLWPMAFWGWQVQFLSFAAFSIIAILVGRRLLRRNDTTTDQPLLNQRAASLVGRTATLADPLINGRGRIHLDDTTWIVAGPDLPSGTMVRIVSGEGTRLTVEALDIKLQKKS